MRSANLSVRQTLTLTLLFCGACASGDERAALAGVHQPLARRDADVDVSRPAASKPIAPAPVPAEPVLPVAVAPKASPTIVYPSTNLVAVSRRAEVCPTRRFVGATSAATCPSPVSTVAYFWGYPYSFSEWSVASSSPRPVLELQGGTTFRKRTPSQKLCVYQSSGDNPDTSKLPTGISLHADCAAVMAQSEIDDANRALAPEVERYYRKHMSALEADGEPLALPHLSTPAVPVEVAMLDSSSTGTTPQLFPPAGDWVHGRAMGLAIHRLTCPDGEPTDRSDCVVRFTSQQVLDGAVGQGAGYLMRLAEAIEGAVTQFEARKATPGAAQHLVINLSLGYDPAWARDANGAMTPTTMRIQAALHRATCAGVLVIGASGNAGYGPGQDSGDAASPMLPAGFMPQVDVACDMTGRDRLIYAASSVDERDMPTQNLRYSAISELSAFGAAVTFDNTTSPGDPDAAPIPRMTGSSYGAAGVSAVAALVWAYLPELTPREVMELVRETGLPLGWQAASQPADGGAGPRLCFTEECLNAGAGSVGEAARQPRRVSICNALERALDRRCARGEDDACDASDALEGCDAITLRAYQGGFTGLDLSVLHAVAQQHVIRPTFATAPKPAQCTYTGTFNVASGASSSASASCPDEVWSTAYMPEVVVETSPGRDGCSVCAVTVYDNKSYLYAALEPSLLQKLTSSALTIGNQRYVLGTALRQVPASFVEDGEPRVVAIELPLTLTPPTSDGGPYASRVELSHALNDGTTSVSTVPVHH